MKMWQKIAMSLSKLSLKMHIFFSNDDSIRSFAINEASKKFNKDNLFLEFGVFKGDSINLFAKD